MSTVQKGKNKAVSKLKKPPQSIEAEKHIEQKKNKGGAPKGNKNALGNNGGHPPLYKSDEELKAAIDKYFNEGVKKRKIVVGKAPNAQLIEVEVPTITGLCYYIGFESRQSFYDLEKNVMFSYTIKRARLFIEQEYEEQLSVGNTTGAIFALKNMGWHDRTELTGNNGSPLIPATIQFKDFANE